MPENDRSTINLQEVKTRADSAHHLIIGFSRAMPTLGDLWQAISHSLSDITILALEVTRLSTALAFTRIDRANLAAACRATLAACYDGEADPLSYLRDELDAQGFGSRRRQP